ncbi:hypothetical protein V8F33_004123 [Rhypophila sp. PSN 637]
MGSITPTTSSSENHSSAPSPVIIIGAGVGGLTLAQCLTKLSIPFQIYERDPDSHSRTQGYALAVHTIFDRLTEAFPSNMPPIRETVSHLAPLLHLPTQFVMYNGLDAKGPFESDSKRMDVETNEENKLLRANRRRLREWLGTGIDVQYGRQVIGVEEDAKGGLVNVKFKDGSEASGILVVGCDGTRSLVRQHLLSGKPDPLQDVPIASIVGEVELHGEDMIRQLEIAHSGAVIVHPSDDPEEYVMNFVGLNEVRPDAKSALFYWLVYFHIGEDQAPISRARYKEACKSPETFLELAMEKTKRFHPAFRNVIERTKVQGIKFPPLVLRDLVLKAEDITPGRVTLLGDAAHCMVPFRGEGGIRAMEDALSLAGYIERIVKGGEDIQEVMTEYKGTLLDRGAKSVTESRQAFEHISKVWTQGMPPMLLGYPTVPIPKRKIVI